MAVEKTISQRRVYDGRILNVRVDEAVLPNGKTVTREVIEHHGACGIVAFDEDGKLAEWHRESLIMCSKI